MIFAEIHLKYGELIEEGGYIFIKHEHIIGMDILLFIVFQEFVHNSFS